MTTGPARHNGLRPKKTSQLTFKATASLFALASLLLSVLILALNVEVSLAQGPSSDLKRRESNIVRLDRARRLAYHTRFLRQVAKSSPRIEVVWSMEKVFPSLRYFAENGSEKDNDAARAVGSIFSRTEDSLARDLCLSALKRIGSKVAKREVLRIYDDSTIPAEWRTICAEYLGMPFPGGSKAVSTSTRSRITISP